MANPPLRRTGCIRDFEPSLPGLRRSPGRSPPIARSRSSRRPAVRPARLLDETLRLWAPIPAFGKAPLEDTVIGGRHLLKKGTRVNILEGPLHTHPKAWERPDEFDIDRWLPENRAQQHPHAYKPFGNGVRACIGRQFALTEARLALALVLQKFKLSDTSDYKMDVREALTRKPGNFELIVRRRQEHERTVFGAADLQTGDTQAQAAVSGVGVNLTVAYGSSLGSCEDLARTIADRGERSGFGTTLVSLDELGDNLPTEGLLTVVAASYNGKAPDNAQRFDDLLAAGLPEGSLADVRLALLGAGNTQWVATYQAFPKRIEEGLLAAGATPVVERGIADAAGDFDGMASRWMDNLWATLAPAREEAVAAIRRGQNEGVFAHHVPAPILAQALEALMLALAEENAASAWADPAGEAAATAFLVAAGVAPHIASRRVRAVLRE
ncbi:cytochrome P450 [Streptomyces sp. NPDC002520]